MICFETRLVALVEQAVIGVHLIVIGGIFLPDFLRLYRVETAVMVLIKLLYIGDLVKPVKKVSDILIPSEGTAFFHRLPDIFRVNDIFLNIPHQIYEDNFVHTRENLSIYQVSHGQFHEPLVKVCLFLHKFRNFVQGIAVLGIEPIRNEIIAVCLMGRRDKFVQPCHKLLPNGASGCRQQDMDSQATEIFFF